MEHFKHLYLFNDNPLCTSNMPHAARQDRTLGHVSRSLMKLGLPKVWA